VSVSRQEEIIACLWLIACLLAFGFGYNVVGWIFGIKASIDLIGVILIALKEIKNGRAST